VGRKSEEVLQIESGNRYVDSSITWHISILHCIEKATNRWNPIIIQVIHRQRKSLGAIWRIV